MRPHPRRVRGAIFDMDGVLCESEPFICRAAIQMLREMYALEVRPEEFLPFVGTGEDRFIGGVAESHGLAIDLGAAKARTYEIYLDLIRGRLQPLMGAPEFVAWCRELGMKLAVATSADTIKMNANLAQIRMPPELFDTVVVGEDAAAKKPAPDIFLLAAKRLGLPPADCLVVEDAVNGVRAAKAAGCRCLALTTSFGEGELLAAGADWTAPHLAGVPEGVFLL
jgi:beta-phosphoglucomutase